MKILFCVPHLSTGGMPKFLLKKIQIIRAKHEIAVFEWSDYGRSFPIQRDEIEKLVSPHFYSCQTDWVLQLKEAQLIATINQFNPDIIHFEELPETFCDTPTVRDIFNKTRPNIKTICSTHGSIVLSVKYIPDLFVWPSDVCVKMYPKFTNYKVWEYPIEDNRYSADPHFLDRNNSVLQVGLWSPHKNQAYTINLIRHIQLATGQKIGVDFIGNMAGNFQGYWGELIKTAKAFGATVHGEKDDIFISKYYRESGVVIMPSTMELNPVVVKEALGCGCNVLISRLSNRPSWYNQCEGIKYLTMDIEKDSKILTEALGNKTGPVNLPPINTDLFHVYEELHGDQFKDFVQHTKNNMEQIDKESLASEFKSEEPKKTSFLCTFINNPKLHIINGKGKYEVRFIDRATDRILHYGYVDGTNDCTVNITHYVDWRIEVWQSGEQVYSYELDLDGQNVYIAFDSSSLGDTIAWMPVVEQFRNQHNCKLTVSTFLNELFDYPEITFVKPGETVYELTAMYTLGVFDKDDRRRHPSHPFIIPLQRVASDILGIRYYDNVKPKMKVNPIKPNVEGNKIIGICTEATSGAKVWNHTEGNWQKVVDAINESGYKTVVIQKAETVIKNADKFLNKPLSEVVDVLSGCTLLIGLPSGLSWLAWALDVPVVMIAGFSMPYTEFDCYRVQNFNVCHGCWNNPDFLMREMNRAGDWHHCPEHQNTPRHFECTKGITPEMVLGKAQQALSESKNIKS